MAQEKKTWSEHMSAVFEQLDAAVVSVNDAKRQEAEEKKKKSEKLEVVAQNIMSQIACHGSDLMKRTKNTSFHVVLKNGLAKLETPNYHISLFCISLDGNFTDKSKKKMSNEDFIEVTKIVSKRWQIREGVDSVEKKKDGSIVIYFNR